jgi:high-affinity Fe2+/Pb2+ permease
MTNTGTDMDDYVFMGRWIWLLPLAYAVHVIEEAYGGYGLIGWMIERGGLHLSLAVFFLANLGGLVIIAAATWGARMHRDWQWPLAITGAILFMNGLSHVAASIAVRHYVSGMYTGIAFYMPLGAVLLVRVQKRVRPTVFWVSVAAGFMIHAITLWVVVFGAPGL